MTIIAPAEGSEEYSAASGSEESVVQVPAFAMPASEFLTVESRKALAQQSAEVAKYLKACPRTLSDAKTQADVVAMRQCNEAHLYPPILARQKTRYEVLVERTTIGKIPAEILTPATGLSAANQKRVLINVHGGGFMFGSGWNSLLESIPIAAVGKIKVVSVDYRLAPEYQFPAASDDVTAVYRALLKDYSPENIGIYGCSAGGLLTAQSVAALLRQGIPLPGAVGMFCAGVWPGGGDSTRLANAIKRAFFGPELSGKFSSVSGYFKAEDIKNPLAYPGLDSSLLAKFPPSLLLTSTRDGAMSSVVTTHAQLVKLGVKADLHVWEGLGHAFFYDPSFPESREAYEVVARFFNEHLGSTKTSIVRDTASQ